MPVWGRWILGTIVVALIIAGPALRYRSGYTNLKRFREVTPGKFYRGGQFTASGFREIVARYGIKSCVNLQEENVDPKMPEAWLGTPHVLESELCRELGVNYYALFGGEAVSPSEAAAGKRPAVIDQYLQILDDPANYPVLIHCKAGLHRTGRLTAIYRIEKENWSTAAAMDELQANGYGTFMASTADNYIVQYVANYKRGVRNAVPAPVNQTRPAGGGK
jgi:tyrosine-protein phosphatase SIW14